MSENTGIETPGVRWQDGATHFTLTSGAAERVDLCLFDPTESGHESNVVALQSNGEGVWEATVDGLEPGQLYGYRVHGPWDPAQGQRSNPAKLLIDPLAAAISGTLTWHESLGDLHPTEGPSHQDTAPFVPRSVIVDTRFDWQDDRPPRIPWGDTVIYECHVRGMTRLHPRVPPELRGTYLGLGHEAILEHFSTLGVTTVELLPVQHFVSEHHLHQLGLTNYFGYNPIGWMAPHAAYATGHRGEQVDEFKTMVQTLHRAGIEVVLDVVFNHTAEGNEHGPTLSHRGVDNRGFYRLRDADARHYENYSGCGNTIHFGHDSVVDLVVACLRYWVCEMHVDGFRFDLATVLGRQDGGFEPDASFFEALERDPVLSQVKLIAEPWDVGPEGYQLGRFPGPWREWNDRYRDTMRAYWRGDHGLVDEMTRRLAGSHDIFPRAPRNESASLNFITSHDGYTLLDLVSYEHRHNWDNGEQNRDGHQHNLSRNWGCEGPTPLAEINSVRLHTMRNFLATLALSEGVPMLSHGDEVGRTQRGNNNAYCQDNELTWMPWDPGPFQQELLEFTGLVFRLRRELGLGSAETGRWLAAHAGDLQPNLPGGPRNPPFGWLRQHAGCQSLTIFNADDRSHLFELPQARPDQRWQLVINTVRQQPRNLRGAAVRVPPRSLLLLMDKG